MYSESRFETAKDSRSTLKDIQRLNVQNIQTTGSISEDLFVGSHSSKMIKQFLKRPKAVFLKNKMALVLSGFHCFPKKNGSQLLFVQDEVAFPPRSTWWCSFMRRWPVGETTLSFFCF